jgi:hypothetical protein
MQIVGFWWYNQQLEKMKIRIKHIEGYYYLSCMTLIHYYSGIEDAVDVSDLSELKIWQYNDLAKQLKAHYPGYYKLSGFRQLEGAFI